MKLVLSLLSLLVCLLLLPVDMVTANGSEIVETTLHSTARTDVMGATQEVVGTNDEDGHSETEEDTHDDDEDAHSSDEDEHSETEEDTHDDDEDAHSNDEDEHSETDVDTHDDDEDAHSNDEDEHTETDVDTHANETESHIDEADGHAETTDGHASDDGHHDDQPFTWRSLVPFFAGVIGALVALVLAKILSPGIKPLDLSIIGLTALTGVLHLVLGLAGDRLLLLNGFGYLALLVLIYLPATPLKALRIPLRIILGLYTLATIIGYFWLHSPAQYDALAILSKVFEVLLLVLVIGSLSKASTNT